MSEDETFVVFQFNGEFDWNTTNSVYRGGEQKMMYLSNFTKYSTLFQSALQATKLVENDEALEIQYLHNNRQAFTLIKVANVGDVNAMLKVSRDNVNGLYLYVSKNTKCSRGVRERHSSDSHKSSSKAHGRDIFKIEANPDIGVNSLHSCDTIYPNVDLEEDIEAIFSFSPYQFALINSQPWAINDDPTIGDKMQEDVGICAKTSVVGEDTNIEDTLVPVDDFKQELLESTTQELWKGKVFPDYDTFRRTLAKEGSEDK
ncbi:hypothetical protein MRB53_005624 [Persea americana]|uniref:Uncharacterized protein n=1 Tax=Persea americana TaxID=3435 RepID=A0ACC2ME03_PERAE|nr:hypothetical protein MRB53_005624 [Persea americana]